MYTALPQMRTKGYGAIYTVIKFREISSKVDEGNSQVNKAEMNISVTSVAEFIQERHVESIHCMLWSKKIH